MTRTLRRRLASLLIFVVTANTGLAPFATAHGFHENALGGPVVEHVQDTDQPCHEHMSKSQSPAPKQSHSLPCCAGTHCPCMGLQVGPVLVMAAAPSMTVHETIAGPRASAVLRWPLDSPLRPPNYS